MYFAVKGDTVFKEKYNTKWRIKVTHDTINKVVTIPVEVVRTRTKTNTVVKEVNSIYLWQKVLMLIGGVSLIYFLALLHNSRKRN